MKMKNKEVNPWGLPRLCKLEGDDSLPLTQLERDYLSGCRIENGSTVVDCRVGFKKAIAPFMIGSIATSIKSKREEAKKRVTD